MEIEGSFGHKLSFWECSFEDSVAVDYYYMLWLNGHSISVQQEKTREVYEENAPVPATSDFGLIFRWSIIPCVL